MAARIARRSAAPAAARAAARGPLPAAAVGVFYGTVSGKTEDIAGEIASGLGAEAQDFGEIGGAEDLLEFDSLVVGAPTWHTGADTDRSGTPLDDLYEEIDGLDLSGKKVAVFGLGDSQSYSDNFCDAIEEIHSHFQGAGAEMVGYVAADGYTYDDSKSVVDGKFLGLPIDEDSESDMSADRYSAWIEQLKGEGIN